MGLSVLLGAIAFIAYFLESIFGFGGTIVFLGASGFFFDFKILVSLSMYLALVASTTVAVQSWRKISLGHFLKIIALTLPGVTLGTILMDMMASLTLLKCFAVFLILYGVQGLFFPQLKLHHYVGKTFVVLGGLVQGLFTTGGPFVLMGYRENFADKTELRATMALFFIVTNIWRMAQEGIFQGGESVGVILAYWWTALPIMAGVYLGYFVHLRLPEAIFKKAMTIGLTLIGLLFLLR